MELSLYIHIIIIFMCLMFSAFFSGTETVLFSFKKSELVRFSYSQNSLEKHIALLLSNPQSILITILLGNQFFNILISSLSASYLLSSWPQYGHVISAAIVTPFTIIFCEILPKIVSLPKYRILARYVMPVISFFHKIFMPLRYILINISNTIIRIFKLNIHSTFDISEDDLSMAIYYGQKYGFLSKDEKEFIHNLLRFTKKTADQAMIHRNRATFIPYSAGIDEIIHIFNENEVVRAPVYKNNIDTIVGLIDSRELVSYSAKIKKGVSIKRLIHPIYHYPASKSLTEMLEEFLRNKIQVAIVVDEYGGTEGVITLEGIIAELFGTGFSLWEDVPKQGVRKEKDIFIIPGDMKIDEFNAIFNLSLQSSESETIGGYFIEKIGRLPKRKDLIKIDNYIATVRHVVKNRIHSIQVHQVKYDN